MRVPRDYNRGANGLLGRGIMRRRFVAVPLSAFLFVQTTAGLAQTPACALDDGSAWPTTLQFRPSTPAAGEAVTALVGPMVPDALFIGRQATVEIVGDQIVIGGQFASSGFLPTAPEPAPVPLGNLPAGRYTVRTNFRGSPSGDDPAPSCNVVQATLAVAAAEPVALPATRWPALLLLGAALALGAGAMRRRAGSR